MAKRRILITGGVSLLGKYLNNTLSHSAHILSTYHNHPPRGRLTTVGDWKPLDVTNKAAIKRVVSVFKPTIIIHLAALSNIDTCEAHPDVAQKINVTSTRYMLEALEGSTTHFIFSSSNAIFSGTHPPYNESAVAYPLNIYGQTKLQAENLVRASHLRYTIIRFTTIFGWPPIGSRYNDLNYYYEKLRKNQPLYLVNDIFFNPVSATEAAQAVRIIILKHKTGIFHVAGKDQISRYTFVKKIAHVFGVKNPHLFPVSHNYFSHLALRPKAAILYTLKMQRVLGLHPQSLVHELRKLSRHEALKTK